jgi:hypothetical protein
MRLTPGQTATDGELAAATGAVPHYCGSVAVDVITPPRHRFTGPDEVFVCWTDGCGESHVANIVLVVVPRGLGV